MNFDIISPRRACCCPLVDEHSPAVPTRPRQDCRFAIIMLRITAKLSLVSGERNHVLYVSELYNLDPR